MQYFKYIIFILFLSLGSEMASAQVIPDIDNVPDDEMPPATNMEIKVMNSRVFFHGDSIPAIIFPTFYKYPPMTFKNDKERDRYNRLVANVKRLLPLAKLAKYTVIETYDYLQTLPTKKEKAEHIKLVEDGLKKQYAPTLKRLSRSQGRLLVKLIDRECGQTGYNIAQAFIGSFKANIYQAMAFCFGNSLTKRYDPEGDDRYTERVVRLVESGQL
ncbi:MAG: DUF4294 domain-containing protein [Prevotella sp.]|jgi:hypothetical protein|uniref:DUF4294 domain-containing protein n=1 Tax=Alloprevotella sp. TaxID=1872471 RepID=UPI0015B1CADA|nr:DUF4294 domain-containing protein [Prevotella sp.]MBD9036276.1 DUF4294 domain-containing protein [Prevotella sp.]MEE0447111.1 DUF4294 domain-containing protein [Prevotellamassilia sp.]